MIIGPLDVIPLWLLLPLIALLLGGALEAGFRFGLWRHTVDPDEQVQPVAGVVAAILGLLALILSFTFGLAASRFDDRRMAVLEEANAIGTAFLRTDLLPEPHRAESKRLFRDYVAIREQAPRGEDVDEAVKRSEAIQADLWKEAMAASEKSTNPEMTGLYVLALNNVIDVHSKRVLLGMRSRIPLVIWIVAYGLSVLGLASVGYYDGLSGTSRSPLKLVLVLCFTIVLYLIADLDRGQEGLLRVGQQSMTDLRQSLR